jgi:hypothetical protein
MDARNPQPLAEFEKSIAAIEESAKGLGHCVAAAHAERSMLGYQAEWHIRGLIYHLRRCFQHYSLIVREVSASASTGASNIIMFAPAFQEMLFEFYALLNLCKISLDNLRVYLKPLFMSSSDHLPKSIRDVLKGSSDCPIYQELAGQPLLEYLIDLRNCLVHYRSFATSDNAIVRDENVGDLLEEHIGDGFLNRAMARADFRKVGPDGISVNVCLPDRIFEEGSASGKRLAQFSYEERLSLISMARNFAQMTAGALTAALHLLAEIDEPLFRFSAKAANG